MIKEILNNQKNNPLRLNETSSRIEASLVLVISLGIIIYMLLHGIFDTTCWKNDLALIFWMIFSSSLIYLKIDSI